MNRKSGKFKLLLLQCLFIGSFLWHQCGAQHHYGGNDDFSDYEEEDRYDYHHPLDPRANYGYRSPGSHADRYADDYSQGERDPYDTREEYPEPRIISPPLPDLHDSDNRHKEENPEPHIITPHVSNTEHRNMYEREPENPAPRPITPHVSFPDHRNMPSREEYLDPRHSISQEEDPQPRLITPHVSDYHDRNMNARDEHPQPHHITPHVSGSQEDNMRSSDEYPYPQHVSRTDDGNMHSRPEYPENPSQPYSPHVSSSFEENMQAKQEDNYEPSEREERPVDPRIITPPSLPSQPRPQENNYVPREREERPVDPRTFAPSPPQPRQQENNYDPREREERPVDPRIITPYPRPQENNYDQREHEERPVDPRTIIPPPQPPQLRPYEHPQYPFYQQARPLPSTGQRSHNPPPTNAEPSYASTRDRVPYQSSSNRDAHIVNVPRLGAVQGIRDFKTIKNRPINAYLGLKYATVRPGIGRFQEASPVELNPYASIDATQEPANCPQFPDLPVITEKEERGENIDDCLTLNIYTPAKSGSYPVLVFVHGEMLFDGSAEEGQPDYFLEHDVVLVNINYRLAPFGYLSTLTEDMPGNVALSDIQKSLEWVQQYIRYFNGNPDQITLMGQAGGATLIHALSLSGKAQGLFHKLILQSGTALNPYFLDEQPTSTLRSFAHFARCPPSRTTEGYVACFESMKTTDLLTFFKRYFESNEPRGLAFAGAFKLIVGDKLGYLPQHPASMVKNNTYPTLVGVTKDAGAFIMTRFYDQLVDLRSRNISDYINVVLKHTVQPRHYQLWKNWALMHIFSPEDIRNPTIQGLVQKLLELVNLILYRAPVIDSIRYTSKNVSTYLYCFDYRGQYHRFGHLRNPLPFEIDATLSDDNIYLFPYPEEVSQLNPSDKSVSSSLVRMWVSFAQYGMPVYAQSIWPNVSTEYGPFLRFTNTKAGNLELDHHFGDGIPVPNLYPEYFTTTTTTTTTTSTTTTTTTTTTTPRPYQPYNYQQRPPTYPNYQYPNYQQYPNRYNSRPYNYRSYQQSQLQPQPQPGATNPHYSNYPANHQ